MERKGVMGRRALVVWLAVLVLLAGLAGCYPRGGGLPELAGATGDTNLTNVVASGNVTAGGTVSGVTVTASGTSSGANVTASAGLTGKTLKLTAGTSITVTAAMAVAPTASYQPVTAAGALTATISTAGAVAGQMLHIVNTSANAITWTEVAANAMAGNFAMDQYDTLTMVFDGTRWIELARVNN